MSVRIFRKLSFRTENVTKTVNEHAEHESFFSVLIRWIFAS